MKLRLLTAAAVAAGACLIAPGTASAGTPGCGTVAATSVSSTNITITQQPLCPGKDSYVLLWVHVPISDGWTFPGSWSTAIPATLTTAGTYVYTCQGTAHNQFQLANDAGQANIFFTDDCGPVEP
ncbi:hypothetical protein ACEZDB_14390 [Streptacidiphilus sp. N1-3]|uniref:Ig-like domain-containing protein n=1 Tax=Streptacidiphilus alkalitolerans TaxID=3342712 RepID=A0ABV6X0T1_9ACTN